MESSIEKKQRDIQYIKGDFQKVLDRIGNLEETLKSLREAKKKDNETIENLNKSVDELKNENFTLLIDNKKLRNELEDLENKDDGIGKWFSDRREKANKFVNTVMGYENSFQVIDQVHLDLEKGIIFI